MRFSLSNLLLFPTLTYTDLLRNAEKKETSFAAHLEELSSKWGTDRGFSGISTFAHLPHFKCLQEPQKTFDIGIIGAPFDTGVSYRPGARFGPRAIRAASARQIPSRSFNPRESVNPYTSWATIVDYGDIPVTPFDNVLALRQMTEAFQELGSRKPPQTNLESSAKYLHKPKLITLGGDHSIALPALRALRESYGEALAVLHFDAHLDTWDPSKYPSSWTLDGDASPSFFTHGSMFWMAAQEGLIANGSSVHAGLRTRLSGNDLGDYDDDAQQGWTRISADEIDEIGVKNIINTIMRRLGTQVPVYLSIDVDVLDPGFAPGTGTPEPGGWTPRELIRILRGVQDLNVVGADIVQVSPAFDGAAEGTALVAAQLGYEVITSMVKRGLLEDGRARKEEKLSRDEL